MNLLINISQIAIITGDNPYKSKRDYLIEFWEKYDKKDYDICVNDIKYIKESDKQIIENISKKYKVDITNEMKSCMESKTTCELNTIKNNIINKITDISPKEKEELSKSLNNVTNTNFGTINETNITKIYENMKKTSIIKDDKFKRKRIIQRDKFNISIGGKIDGIDPENDTIIEVKNRIHKLFYTLKEYEKVQIMCYIHIFSSKKAHLIEALKKKDNTTINIIEVNYDETYMNNIIQKLELFGNFFYEFMKNKQMRIEILKNECFQLSF